MSELHRDDPPDEISRRSFVKLLGASLALAGVGGCVRPPREKILPYVADPPELTPGIPQHYATAMPLDGYATGLLVESHEGRPTKIEGNPDHPASLGAAGVLEQASLLQLYDPDRAGRVRLGGGPATWDGVAARLAPGRLSRRVGARGAGLRFLLEPTSSPSLVRVIARVRELYPECGFHFWSPSHSGLGRRASTAAFGQPLEPIFDLTAADVVLDLDADLLASGPFHLRYAREFATRRRPTSPAERMSRLYVAESALSVTGGAADHRLRVASRNVGRVAAGVLAEVLRIGGRVPGMPASLPEILTALGREGPAGWARAVARDLIASRGRGLVIAGDRQPESVHLLAHLLNAACGNLGRSVRYIDSTLLDGGPGEAMGDLVSAIRAGAVGLLVVLETNPAYAAPADLEFQAALSQVPECVCLNLYQDETAALAGSFIPALHYLESWGDVRALDGTASVIQPLIAPLHGGKSPLELLAAILGEPMTTAYEMVQGEWRKLDSGAGSQSRWEDALRRGVIEGTASPIVAPALRWEPVVQTLAGADRAAPQGLELLFLPDPKVHDGRFGNNAWLQELPDPLTKLTWDNAALLSPATAARLGLETGEVVSLRYRGRELLAPALVLPGQADDSVTLRLGYGRRAEAETVARGVGVDAYRLRMSDALHAGDGLTLEPVPGRVHQLALTQAHWRMEGRPLVASVSWSEYRERTPTPPRGRPLSLYEPVTYQGEQWAMTIDLAACTGCSACVVACQAENNVPVVGKPGVLDGREMHWLRIDRYFEGAGADPDVRVQPMLCQHCEKAPCEYVCPVEATVHSPDGLNEMVYNRCVGTRFCSNNCPYKVRRFNWFDYNAELAETVRMAKNPDVTVRARGVMEKCTFCVQRIREAEIGARLEGRPLRTGEVRTACQQACPTQAIAFGSLSDPRSEVVQRRREPRSYAVLDELGTVPRVRYLARITNPNPELDAGHAG